MSELLGVGEPRCLPSGGAEQLTSFDSAFHQDRHEQDDVKSLLREFKKKRKNRRSEENQGQSVL